ncbi:MAG: hypothetical protein OSB70_17415 [Myxococcota bacterium]|nr:hypothetical protein [Myxococcota bacterium]
MTTQTARLLMAMVALLFMVLACGKGEEGAPAPSSSADQGAASSETKMPSLPSSKPQTITDELAVKIEIPDFYPADGPVYPNTAPSKSFVKGDQINLMFGTNDGVEQVLDFMNAELPRLGWENAHVQRRSASITIEATKGSRDLRMILSEIDSGRASQTTLIAVSLTND